jgi:DNA-binding HxlR family transcriptional regulator
MTAEKFPMSPLPKGAKRSPCPIAAALDLVGDKWTLLVMRDLFVGKSRFGEFEESPERIPTNILAERLKRLEAGGMIERQPYQQRPVRYTYALTKKGRGFLPVLQAISRWGNDYMPGTWVPPAFFMEMKV